ncbi:hypothetical protein HDU85_002457 [Gaertneriomyces sp. JEL0708]|nr:hypothetical protein HDU85_002457 [Gaertneriomyces sp. JEL0708]
MEYYDVNDPYCRYETVDGKTIISYAGYVGTWENEESPCVGVNLLGANVTIIVAGLLLTTACVVRAVKYALKRGWTLYNKAMVIGAAGMWIGLAIELYAVIDWFQLNGKPDWGHIPKVFWYTAAICGAVVQGFRIQFILIARNRPQHWKKPILLTFVGVGVVMGLAAVALFMTGVFSGIENVPLSPFVPYIGFFLITGVVDVVLSVYILRICANNNAVLNAFDKYNLTSATIDMFVRQNRVAAALALVGELLFVICFLLGGLFNFGYTFSYLSTFGLPVQFTFLLHSLYCLRKTQEAKRGVSSVNGVVKTGVLGKLGIFGSNLKPLPAGGVSESSTGGTYGESSRRGGSSTMGGSTVGTGTNRYGTKVEEGHLAEVQEEWVKA